MTEKLNKHARALAKAGASKGGKARAAVLTAEERKEIAQKAIITRWARKKGISLEEYTEQVSDSLGTALELTPPSTNNRSTILPVSAFPGTLTIGNISFSAHVLDNLKRVIVQREVVRILTDRDSGNLTKYLSANALSKYIDPEHIASQTIEFAIPGTQYTAIGYEATLLIEICDAYLKARDDGVLTKNQLHLAKRAEVIMRACAKVGIIALVDEATGYQEVREEHALQLKLQAFIADDLQEWARMFPEEFWFELARLENIHYSPRSRPLRWGKYVLAFVYAAVDKDVAKALKKRIPNPQHGQNLHQLLKEYGRDKMQAQLNQVLGVMKTCKDMDDFKRKFDWVFKKSPYQLTFFDLTDSMAMRS